MGFDGQLRFNTSVDESGINKGTNNINKTMKKTALVIGALVTVLGAGLIKITADFEQGMAGVKSVSQATAVEFESLKNKAKEMGKITKFSATESANAMKYMGQNGWKATQIIKGLDGIMNLSAATGEDLASVTDIVTGSMKAFKLEASQSSYFADLLAATTSSAATNVNMLGESFKYAAPIAGALGASAKDTAFALGLMANSNIKASSAGTALRSTMTRLANPTAKIAGVLGSMNAEVVKNKNGTINLRGTIDSLRKGFEKLTPQQKAANAEIISGRLAMGGLLAIVDSDKVAFDELSNSIDNAKGRALEMALILQDTLSGQLGILKSGIQGVAIEIGEVFAPVLKALIKNYIIPAVAWFSNLISMIKSFKKVIGGSSKEQTTQAKVVTSAVKETKESHNGISTAIDKSKKSQEGVTEAVKKTNKELKGSVASFDAVSVLQEKQSADNNSGATAGAIGGGGADIGGGIGDGGIGELDLGIPEDDTDSIVDALDISPKIARFLEAIEPFKTIDFTPLKEAFGGLKEELNVFGEIVFDGFIFFIEEILVPLTTFVATEALPVFIQVLSAALNVLNTTLTTLKPLGIWLWETFLKPIAKFVGELLILALTTIVEKLGNLSEWIANNQSTVETLALIFGGLTLAIGALAIVFGVITYILPIVTNLISVIGVAIAFLTSPIGLIILAIAGLTTAFVLLYKNNESFSSGVTKAWETIKTFAVENFAKITEVLTKIWTETIKPILLPALKMLLSSAGKVFKSIGKFMVSLWDNVIGPILIPAFESIRDSVLEVLPKIAKNFSEIFAEISILLTAFWDNVLSPLIDYIAETILPLIKPIFVSIGLVVADVFGSIIAIFGNVVEVIKGLIKFLVGVFTGDWEKAWQGIVDVFGGIFKTIVNLVRTPLNFVIRMINSFLDLISKIKIKIPSVDIPGLGKIGGQEIGFGSLPNIPEIPALATGSVVPPNSKFLAMLGDNKQEHEIVSPLSTMKQAFIEAMNENGGGEVTINFTGDLAQLGKVLKPVIDKENSRQGRSKSKRGN